MAKEKSIDKEERRREKHAKKEKRSEKEGIHKSKKEKKEKKVAVKAVETDSATTLLNTLEKSKPENVVIKEDDNIAVKVKSAPLLVAMKEDDDIEATVKSAPLLGALVPFANPLADEKVQKKVLKGVRKAAKNKSLKRGVKEVVKALRKSSNAATAATAAGPALSAREVHGVVVLAADISPMDVISHIPVLCEDHGVPYIFVPSRAELGAAGNTKRPTSVVLVTKEKGGKKKVGEGEKTEKTQEEGEFLDVYSDLVKVIMKASRDVRI